MSSCSRHSQGTSLLRKSCVCHRVQGTLRGPHYFARVVRVIVFKALSGDLTTSQECCVSSCSRHSQGTSLLLKRCVCHRVQATLRGPHYFARVVCVIVFKALSGDLTTSQEVCVSSCSRHSQGTSLLRKSCACHRVQGTLRGPHYFARVVCVIVFKPLSGDLTTSQELCVSSCSRHSQGTSLLR